MVFVYFISIRLGFAIKSSIGERWNIIRVCSVVLIGPIFERNDGKVLFFVFLRISRE